MCILPNSPIAILELSNYSCCGWLTFLNVGIVSFSVNTVQYARDDEEAYFCINQISNIDNDLYCNSNDVPNHLFY